MPFPVILYDKKTVTADGVDVVTITDIPLGSDLLVTFIPTGEVVVRADALEETEVTLTFSVVGRYTIQFSVGPFTHDDGTFIGAGGIMTEEVEAT